MVRCNFCKEQIQPRAKKCIHCGEWQDEPFYKKWWGIAIIVYFVLILLNMMMCFI